MANPLKITVLGSGNIGGTVGAEWAAAGHTVVYGVRDVTSAKAKAAQERSDEAPLKTIPEAIALRDIILFAIPGAAMPDFFAKHGAALDGKLLIDATNRFSEKVMNALPTMQQYAPHSDVYRVFNSLGWEVFAEPNVGGVQADHFFAGPDSPNRATVQELIRAVGLRPIYVGGYDTFHWVDALGGLWAAMAFGQKRGRHIAFKLLTDQ